MRRLVRQRRVIALRIAERLEGRHLHVILRDVVASPVSAVADFGAGRGEEFSARAMRSTGSEPLCGGRMVLRGQSFDLLDVENRVPLHERNIPLRFLAGLSVGLGAGDARSIDDKAPLLALADMGSSSRACLKVIQMGAAIALGDGLGPQHQDVDP